MNTVDVGALELTSSSIRQILERAGDELPDSCKCASTSDLCAGCAAELVLGAVKENPYLLLA